MFEIAIILISAFVLRLYGISWDLGNHLHPDERMLIMVADRINFFKNLNPDFFNYGSLPIYILKGLTQLSDYLLRTNLATYDGMLLFGRALSISYDLFTLFLIYKISFLLFKNKKISILSGFVYGIAFFPIQNSHFFVVDVFLTMLTTSLLWLLLHYLEEKDYKKTLFLIAFVAINCSSLLATKFTAIIFLPIVALTILTKYLKDFKKLFIDTLIFFLLFVVCYFLFMPYAFIEMARFTTDISSQLKMNSNPYIFPYTLQYVTSLPYLYYLKNISIWGLGPFISLMSLIGLISLIRHIKLYRHKSYLLFFSFYLLYFIVVGRSAVKFMRYMLPIYPFFAIMAGYGLYLIKKSRFKLFSFIFILLAIAWSFMFVNIYSSTHTRIDATDWILKNIPSGKTLAVEHWDDRLPISNSEKYNFQELTLYDQPDDDVKWSVLNEKINKSDYIIIASNRLYVPLQKLEDCSKFKSCYPKTTEYYQNLFSGKLNFKKVAEFTDYPKLEFLGKKLEINDDSADESFTVYDHPKIMIFERINAR